MAAHATYNPLLEEQTYSLKQIYATKILLPIALGNSLCIFATAFALAFACILFVQSWPRFSRYNKISFCLIVCLNLAQAAISFEDICFNGSTTEKAEYQIRRYTYAQALQPLPAGGILLVAQLFFLKRCKYFLKNKLRWLTFVLLVGVLLGFVCVIFVVVASYAVRAVLSIWHVSIKTTYLTIANQLWFWISMFTEVGIAATLSWRLWKFKSLTGEVDDHTIGTRVESRVNQIVRATLGSALPTALATITGAIIYVITRHTWLYYLAFIIMLPIPALETFSFLYALAGYPELFGWMTEKPIIEAIVTAPSIPSSRTKIIRNITGHSYIEEWKTTLTEISSIPALPIDGDEEAKGRAGDMDVVWGQQV